MLSSLPPPRKYIKHDITGSFHYCVRTLGKKKEKKKKKRYSDSDSLFIVQTKKRRYFQSCQRVSTPFFSFRFVSLGVKSADMAGGGRRAVAGCDLEKRGVSKAGLPV